MATIESNEQIAYDATPSRQSAGYKSAQLIQITRTVTTTASDTTGDIYRFFKPPEGWQLRGDLSKLDFEATGLTDIDLGDEEDDNRYLDAEDVSSAGQTEQDFLVDHVVDANTGWIQAIIRAGTVTADRDITAVLVFAAPGT